jgi:hypothetical protein
LSEVILGILSSSNLSRWPSQLILWFFIYFTIFSPLLSSSSSRFFLLFHSQSSYLEPHILLNIIYNTFFFKIVTKQNLQGAKT